MKYAGFWIRLLASVIDTLISLVVLLPLIAIAGIGWATAYNDAASGVIVFFANWVAGWLYYALFESGTWQATPGKRLMGLRVTDLAGNRISFGRASGRYFSKILSALVFYVGFIMVGVTSKKQGIHDKLADTLVLRGRPGQTAALLAQAHDYADPSAVTGYVPSAGASRWVLSGFDDGGHVVRLSFSHDKPELMRAGLIVGRDAKSSDLHMNDQSVSRRHARVYHENGSIFIEDLGSGNGTFINGQALKKGVATELPDQGTVTFGAVQLAVAKYS